MRAEFINPFLASVGNTFKTMLSCEVTRGQMYLSSKESPRHEISGVIGLSGVTAGMAVLSLSQGLALHAAGTMLMSEYTELNDDVSDAVGELTNMVAGGAKAQLQELKLQLGLPNVVVGTDFAVRFPSNVTPLVVPYTSPWGDFTLEVGFAPINEPALVS